MIYFTHLRWKNLLSTGNQYTEVFLNKSRSTLIVGENGSGKTTMLDALTYGLYNKPFRDITLPQLINSITNKHLVVEVEFRIGGHEYKVVRGMKPRRFEIHKNGSLIDQQAKDFDQQEQLEKEILKISYKSFKQVIVLGSTNYAPFMTLKDKERRAVIEDLLDVGVFSIMNSLLQKRRAELAAELDTINTELAVAKSNLEIHVNHLESLHIDKQVLIDQANAKKDDLTNKIQALIDDNNRFTADLDQLNASIADQQEVENRSKTLIGLERQLENKIEDFKKHVHFFEDHDTCPTCDQSIDNEFKSLTVEQYNAKVAELSDALTDVDNKYNTASARLSEISAILKQIQEINADITSNNVSIRHHNEVIDELNDDIDRLQAEKANAGSKSDIKRLEKQIKTLDASKKNALEEREIQEISGVLLKDSGIKTRIVRRYIPVINKLINKYLAAMSFYIQFEIDENFKETIKSLHRDEFSYHSFSEGEKMRINLAILFTWRAIAKMRNSMSTNLLILDEVFDSSLDTIGVDDFLKIVEDLSGDTNLFIISHKETLYDKFHSVIKFTKNKNFSMIAKPEAVSERV
jgi:DNA repair exonuclease SbcCD ATPase subunit